MSPIYIHPPSSSPLPYLELKGDQLLGQIHELATCNSSHLSYPNLDKNPSFDESLALDYSRHPQDIKVDKVLSRDKANNQGQGFQSSTQPQNIEDGSGCSYYDNSSDHSDQNRNGFVNKNYQNLPRKWKPSKVRITQKMTTKSKDMGKQKFHRSFEQQRSNIASRDDNNDNNNNNSIRVCSDCHTTTTPLWRSGSRGPKSLCNACGIRQRRARRAAMAAVAKIEFTKDAIVTPMCVEAPKSKSPQKEKRKGEFDNRSHPLPLKKRGKEFGVARVSCDNNSHNNNGLMSSSKNNCIKATSQRTFLLHDEVEGAFLLMSLSSGFVYSS